MASVRIWQKGRIVLDHLTFRQRDMVKIGTVAVASVKGRVQAAKGPTDSAAKPLTKRHAIFKSKLGLGNRRNLTLSGEMLSKFQVRTVTDHTARASVTSGGGTGFPLAETLRRLRRRARQAGNRPAADAKLKAWVNQKREPWMVLSPKDQEAVVKAARMIFDRIVRTLFK